jgi:hypothetical protein
MMRIRRAMSLALVLSVGLLACCEGDCEKDCKKCTWKVNDDWGLVCDDLVAGKVRGIGDPNPDPLLKEVASCHWIDLKAIRDPAVDAVLVRLTSVTGDADLHIASPVKTKPLTYVIASTEGPGIEDWVRISLTGLESPSASVPSPTLQDYRDIAGGIEVLVWGIDAWTEFTLEVVCEDSTQ